MYNGSFYNPYMSGSFQVANNLGRTGLGIKELIRGFNFNNFLTSAGKTLNVINQAIPIFYQVKPIFNNARTMLRVVGAVRDSSTKKINTNMNTTRQNYNNINTYNNNNSIINDNSNSITNSNFTSTNSSNPAFFL